MANAAAVLSSLGRYQIVEELGRGAMGVVYLGVDPVLARPVAIKVVLESEHMSEADVEQFHARFRHEAEAAGRLSHPDIVQIYDVGPNYMVMEYIDGRALSVPLREGTSFSVRQIVALVERVADAIDYAHRNGIVHRDIKPGNIMTFGPNGVKVLDFGVARLDTSNLTAAGSVIGSVRYMAPEQMLGEKVDGRADVFSLAAVAYELLTAQPPFPGTTITDVVSRVVRGEHVPPCSVETMLPDRLDQVFARAFAKPPADRFARALDFARGLAEAGRAVLDLTVVHLGRTELPINVEATADEEAELRSTSTRTSPDGLLAGPVRLAIEHPADSVSSSLAAAEPLDGVRAADATVLMGAQVAPATKDAPGLAAAEPAGRATARTVIIEPAPSQHEAVLMLESEPSEASVFIDGVPVGATPLPELDLAFGQHEVRLEAAGHEPATFALELGPQRPLQAITLTLAPARARDGSVHAGEFVAFGPDVLPPSRVAGSLPVYPPGARERGLSGSPAVDVWIGQKGEVMDLAILESAGAILDGALLDAVAHWRFAPGRLRGVPVAIRMTVRHYFRP